MKKFIFGICAFILYQGFALCLINIITYKVGGIKLSILENIFCVILNILIIFLLTSFFYLFYHIPYYKNRTDKFNRRDFTYWILLFFICWIFSAMIAAIYDIYTRDTLKTIYEYLKSQFRTSLPIIWFMTWCFLCDKFFENKKVAKKML